MRLIVHFAGILATKDITYRILRRLWQGLFRARCLIQMGLLSNTLERG